ncbi:MAG: RimK/LysX family protein [Alphaproteobacteria bacterium]
MSDVPKRRRSKHVDKPRKSPVLRLRLADEIPIVGWREWVGLPDLGIDPIKAKIDSGARTSAIHAFRERVTFEKGTPHVAFMVRPGQRGKVAPVECVAEIRDERVIKSSTGHKQVRYVIETGLSLGGRVWPIELTLADRDPMGFRMLLGRQAIRGRCLIDTSHSYLDGRNYADITSSRPSKRKIR